MLLGLPTWLVAIAVLLVLVVYLGFIKYKPRDWRFLFNGANVLISSKVAILRNQTTDVSWANRVAANGRHHPAIQFDSRVWTLGDVDDLTTRVACFLLELGLQKDDVLGLYMTNRPEYVAFWLGASKIGVQTALLNCNQRARALEHSVSVAQCSVVVFETFLANSIEESVAQIAELVPGVQFACLDGSVEFPGYRVHNMQDSPAFASAAVPTIPADSTAKARQVHVKDPVLYVYTSGTTGLPKAAVISHARLRLMGSAFPKFTSITPKDRVFNTLPLYHSAGGIVGMGMMIWAGATVVLNHRKHGRFSASNFWHDVRESRATVIQYIGEICRYLLAQPPHADDARNHVRLALGNGLRQEIWAEFKTRFGIEQILEFYAATEGAGALLNTENKVGAIGFVSPLISLFLPTALVKFDRDAELPIRDAKTGLCMRADIDEAGEYVVKILNLGRGVKNFTGYKNAKATSKKVISNVFKQGDSWFRSGDLLRADKDGFIYFVDRIGDTFRWKGENVSTGEVAAVLAQFSNATSEPNVYGVSVPGHDGRAGMVTFAHTSQNLQPSDIDFDGLLKHVQKNLPAYAWPLFVRVSPEQMEITGTFKHRKVNLVKEGFDPTAVSDPLFFLQGGKRYVPLTKQVYDAIVAGNERV